MVTFAVEFFLNNISEKWINTYELWLCSQPTTTTKPFVPSIWGRLHEPKENYVRSRTWISFLHWFLSSNMSSLRPLASISCRVSSIRVFFSVSCALLTCPNLICSTRRTDASVSLRRTRPGVQQTQKNQNLNQWISINIRDVVFSCATRNQKPIEKKSWWNSIKKKNGRLTSTETINKSQTRLDFYREKYCT